MGKGGTKFVGDAVSVRRKAAPNDTVKGIKRNLDKFLETGVHPEIERMRQERANQLPVLPDLDVHRPYVFLDITLAGKPLGRLVIELYDDIVPVAANHFRNRCLPGSAAGIAGTSFHKLLPRYALHGGLPRGGSGSNSGSSGADGGGIRLQPNTHLRSVEAGLVAVALVGDDFAITLDRALDLDRSHQVVGRIHKGRELLDALGDLRTLPDDSPVQRVVVQRAGPTNHLGNHEELGEGGSGGAGTLLKDAATRLQEAAEETRSALMDALSEGLKRKRTHDSSSTVAEARGAAGAGGASAAATAAAGPSSATSGAGLEPQLEDAAAGSSQRPSGQHQKPVAAPMAAAARSVKARLLDSMLGDLGESGSSSSSSDEDVDGDGS